jgi:alpha-beta hydrolase superfamily lysophospholipase
LNLKNYGYPHQGEFRGVVFYIHGFTDYIGRFAHVGQEFSKLGYDFYAMDQRGHGKSEGKLAYVPSIDQITDDTILYHRLILEKFYIGINPKIYVVAHSMGAMQILNLLVRK